MLEPLSASTATRLEKAAFDNGFERQFDAPPRWLGFASTQAPLRIWLTAIGDDLYLGALSQAHVAQALGTHGTPLASPLPEGAAAGRSATSVAVLHDVIRRAFQLSRALPNEPLHKFEQETASLPRSTEVERLVVQRVGQEIFRQGLLDYWEGRCAITRLAVPDLLRASHIKPWKDCAADAERLDVYNGLLLAPHLDLAFDKGFFTLEDDGRLTKSAHLPSEASEILGLHAGLILVGLTDRHRGYLSWHREHVFRN